MSLLTPIVDFDGDEPFLDAILGLLAGAADLRALLERPSVGAAVPPADQDDDLLDAALGLAYLAALPGVIAERWAASGAKGPPRTGPSVRPAIATLARTEDLLR